MIFPLPRSAAVVWRWWTFAALVLALPFGIARAQRADSARAAAVSIPADSLRPPISPRRAFVYSFLAPGYGQARLGRHKAAALVMLFEGVCLSMIRESAADLREARRTSGDTLVLSWTGEGGVPQRTVQTAPYYGPDNVRSRRRHEEDWIALLIANHLFAGADAFVAANLWDLPAELSLNATPDRAAIVASIAW